MGKLKTFLSDIRSWILLFFILRLFGITDPPLEVAHNWRQTTVTMVARNFLEGEANPLYPKIDIAGEKTGITGMEFPVLNYLIYLVSLVFGYAHWYGRLINLIVSSIGIYFFYKLVLKYFSPSLAFHSAFMLLLSVWFTYSRKIMPDTFSMSLFMIGYYYGSNYLDRQASVRNILLFFVFVLLGILSKLPCIYLFCTLPFFLLQKQISLRPKVVFLLVTGLITAIISVYYFYWTSYLTQHFGFSHFFMGKSISEGMSETFTHLGEALDKFYEEALGYSGFILFFAGLVLLIVKKDRKLASLFCICFLGFLFIIFKSGFAFYHHTYYIVPFAPVMAVVAAFALEHLKKGVAVVLFLFGTEAILSKNHDFYIKEQNMRVLNLEQKLDAFFGKHDLILINSGNVPTPMYFAHRKGWVEFRENITKAGYIDSLRQKGLKGVVILKRAFGEDLELPYRQVYNDEDMRIYKP